MNMNNSVIFYLLYNETYPNGTEIWNKVKYDLKLMLYYLQNS
jgi:hypothetical protein